MSPWSRTSASSVLAHLHHPPRGAVEARVTYSDSCHLRHAQKVVRQPRELLSAFPGLQLVELAKPDRCCGSAGVYNIVQLDTANAGPAGQNGRHRRRVDLRPGGAGDGLPRMIVTTNTGCDMQLIAGVRRAGLDVPVMHVMDMLDDAYAAEEDAP